jgi:hypothetical protein
MPLSQSAATDEPPAAAPSVKKAARKIAKEPDGQASLF